MSQKYSVRVSELVVLHTIFDDWQPLLHKESRGQNSRMRFKYYEAGGGFISHPSFCDN